MSRRSRPRRQRALKRKLGQCPSSSEQQLYCSTQEDRRAEVVQEIGLLDTEPEERFDRICRLAQDVMEAPATYISFIDRKRQWFKSTVGMGEVKETPREGTFCDYAIRRSLPTVVLNAEENPLFSRSPYVTEGPQVRFYAGIPLTVDGERVGTLCALDFEPRNEVSSHQLQQLDSLARMAEEEFSKSLKGRAESAREVGTVLAARFREAESVWERMNPETAVELLNLCFEACSGVIERWDGWLERLGGDGFRAAFFGPDHGQRAAACGIELQHAILDLNLGLDERRLPLFCCGLSLASGPLAVGRLRGGGVETSSLLGRTPQQADEMSESVPGGAVLVAETTAKLLGSSARLGTIDDEGLSGQVLLALGDLESP